MGFREAAHAGMKSMQLFHIKLYFYTWLLEVLRRNVAPFVPDDIVNV